MQAIRGNMVKRCGRSANQVVSASNGTMERYCTTRGQEHGIRSCTGAIIATNGRDLESVTAGIVFRGNSHL